MIRLNSRKQVGTLYHFTKDGSSFWSICKSLQLRAGSHQELVDGRLRSFVSFSRSIDAPKRSDRWKYGFIIDGDVLSDRYPIKPISFAYTELSRKSNKPLRIKALRLYDDGTANVNLIQYGTISISMSVYNELKDWIMSLPPEIKEKKRLVVKGEGKVRRGGKLLAESFVFNTPHGSPDISNELTAATKSELSRSFRLYEAEERVWLDKSTNEVGVSTPSIPLKSILQGVVLPKVIPDTELVAIQEGIAALAKDFDLYPDSSDIGYAAGPGFKIIRY